MIYPSTQKKGTQMVDSSSGGECSSVPKSAEIAAAQVKIRAEHKSSHRTLFNMLFHPTPGFQPPPNLKTAS
jgi:hypothetical protein